MTTQDAIQYGHACGAMGIPLTVGLTIKRHAMRYHRLSEEACNGPRYSDPTWTEEAFNKWAASLEKQQERIEKKVADLLPEGIVATWQCDPRGAALTLTLDVDNLVRDLHLRTVVGWG